MNTDQVNWVLALDGKAASIQASADRQNRKDQLLADAFSVLDSKVGEIKIGESFAIELKSTGLSGFMRRAFKASPKTMKSVSEKGDQDDEFDTGHDLDDTVGLTPEQATALTKAHSIIVEQVDILRKEIDPSTKKPLFADIEIAKEIFEPLMRRKIIPENAITDRYSDVSRTFDSASSQYDIRLQAYAESVSSTDKIASKLGLSSGLIKSAGSASTSIMGMLTAVVPELKGFPLSEATDICTACTTTLTAPLDIAATVLKDKGLNTKNVESIAKSVMGAATSWVTAAFDIKFDGGTDQDSINKQLGKAIVSGLKMGLSGVVFASKVAQGGDKAKEAFEDLADIVEQCFVCAGAGGAYNKGVKDDGALKETGAHIKAGLLGAKELAIIMMATESEDPVGEVTKAMQRLVKAAIEDGATVYAEKRQEELKKHDEEDRDKKDEEDPTNKDKHQQEYSDQQTFHANFDTPNDTANIALGMVAVSPEGLDVTNMLKLAQTLSTEDLKKLFESDPGLKANKAAQKLMIEIAKRRDEELAEAIKSSDEDIAKDEQVFRQLLSGSETSDSEEEVEKIEILILQIKKDQMIIAMAESMFKMGPAAVAAFLPPAAIAADAVQIAIAMRKAVVHLMAWAEWNDNVTDAKSAMSIQVSAMANRAGLSGRQATEQSVIALEGAIKLIGDAFGTAGGPFAPAGVALSKGVSALSSLKDIILKIYDEVQLKRNWEKYEKARSNPGDRKAIRAAIKGNPTLAKYVIAYGGVIAADPVAKNALRKCGLSAKVLQSPNTNEQKVVAYLETLYAEDPVILERPKDPPKWMPGPIELTAGSISSFSHAAQTEAKPALAEPIPKTVVKGCIDVDAAKVALDKARTAWQEAAKKTPHVQTDEDEALKEFVGCLNDSSLKSGSVYGSLVGWKPVATDGKPQKDVLGYRNALIQIAQRKRKQADRELAMYDADPL